MSHLSGNGDLDLNSGLERDGGDLLDDIGGRGQVDQSLVDPHLVSVPSLGTLTTGGLSGGVLEDLGGESNGSLDVEVPVLGSVDKITTELLQRLNVPGGKGDPDLVGLSGLSCGLV